MSSVPYRNFENCKTKRGIICPWPSSVWTINGSKISALICVGLWYAAIVLHSSSVYYMVHSLLFLVTSLIHSNYFIVSI